MRKLTLLLIAPILFCFSCRNIKDVECTGAKGFKINKINTEGIDAEVILTIKNPNNFAFKVHPSEFDILYGDVKVGKARMTQKVKIRKKMEQDFPFELKADFKGVSLTDVMKLLETVTRQSFIEVKGDLKVGKFVLRKTFPVNVKQKLAVEG